MSNFIFWEIYDNQDFGSVLLLSGFLIKKYLSVAPTDPTRGGGIRGMGTGGYIQRVLYTFALCLLWQMNQTITL